MPRRDRRHRIRYSTSTDSRQTDPASSLCRHWCADSRVPCSWPSPEPSSNPAVVHYRYLRYKGKAAKAAELERVKGVEFARTLTAFKQMRNDELSDQLKIWKLIEKNATVKKTTGEP